MECVRPACGTRTLHAGDAPARLNATKLQLGRVLVFEALLRCVPPPPPTEVWAVTEHLPSKGRILATPKTPEATRASRGSL